MIALGGGTSGAKKATDVQDKRLFPLLLCIKDSGKVEELSLENAKETITLCLLPPYFRGRRELGFIRTTLMILLSQYP